MDTVNSEKTVESVGDRLRPQVEQAKRQLIRLNGQITTFIDDHPAVCLLGAVGLGYLLARLARRQS